MKLILVLGDQLSLSLSSLAEANPGIDLVVMAEVGAEATYVTHHKQKIALLFSAMRHFAAELCSQGHRVHYHDYDPLRPNQTLFDVLSRLVEDLHPECVLVTECGEYRLQHQINGWHSKLGVDVRVLADSRFICSQEQFEQWASGRKQLRMEYFYRDMRRRTGLLMQDSQPEGGLWNYDNSNRKPYRGEPALPALPAFEKDETDLAVLALVEQHFSSHPGTLGKFNWPTTRLQALQALEDFLEHRLPLFGDFQDAMTQGQSFMFHSLLSTSINCGLLTPMEVCVAAQARYHSGLAPLNAVEGFIRQIIGWREYVRGIYWMKMPLYADENFLDNTRELPSYYWTGDTRMNCMRECFNNTLDHAYAHHIQRLMITGNFALLAGVSPTLICDWYLAVYADAYDWVELPNTLGMVMHADGGLLASKPYAASGSYINRMSDYCRGCHYSVKTSTDSDSCPFNSLYWHFIDRHRAQFEKNPRMSMIYRSYDNMSADKKRALRQRGDHVLEHINEL
jgi:deoxyribodipyrimidine photolyase-related protein